MSGYFLIFLFLFCSVTASAQEPNSCQDQIGHIANLQYQVSSFGDGVCFLSLHPMNVEKMKYRDYLITSDGMLMVFISTGDGPISKTTGAREYFFPAKLSGFSFALDQQNQNLLVTMQNGDVLTFDAAKADLVASSAGALKLRGEIDPKFKGGVEFESYKGIIIDSGFKMGGSPSTSRSGKSLIRVSMDETTKPKQCLIKNAEIFKMVNGNARLNLNLEQAQKLVMQRCP